MTDDSALYAIGKPGEMPRQWAEGDPDFVRAQMRPGEVAARAAVDGSDPVAKPLPAASDLQPAEIS